MSHSNTLVIYYSRTGATAKVAEAIAQATGADIEALADTVDRRGPIGYLRSLYDAARRRGSTLAPLKVDPVEYDLVIIGSPDWGAAVASPVRSFLKTFAPRLKKVAFFATDGVKDHAAVFRDMTNLVGHEPVATLDVLHADAVNGRIQSQVAAFVRSLPPPPMLPPQPPAPTELRL